LGFLLIDHTGATEMTTSQKNKLMEDLQLVIEDAEEMLRMTAKEAGDSAADVRKRVQARMEQAKVELAHIQAASVAQAKAAGQAADAFVHENPWKSVGVAAGLGLVLGLLLSRR